MGRALRPVVRFWVSLVRKLFPVLDKDSQKSDALLNRGISKPGTVRRFRYSTSGADFHPLRKIPG